MDDFDEISLGSDTAEDVIVGLSAGRAYVLPRSMARRLDAEQLHLVGEVERCAGEIERARAALDELVPAAREAGVSWSVIAWATRLTDEGARRRWSDVETGRRP